MLPLFQSCADSTCPKKLSNKVIWRAGGRSEALRRRLQYPALLLRLLVRRRFAPGSSSAFGTDGDLARLRAHQAISTIGSVTLFGESRDAKTETAARALAQAQFTPAKSLIASFNSDIAVNVQTKLDGFAVPSRCPVPNSEGVPMQSMHV
jgi:hypothetical protein